MRPQWFNVELIKGQYKADKHNGRIKIRNG